MKLNCYWLTDVYSLEIRLVTLLGAVDLPTHDQTADSKPSVYTVISEIGLYSNCNQFLCEQFTVCQSGKDAASFCIAMSRVNHDNAWMYKNVSCEYYYALSL